MHYLKICKIISIFLEKSKHYDEKYIGKILTKISDVVNWQI